MKILIVSKCPTHPTDAGNRWWILSQAETFMSMGHEVHFLYIQELPMRKDKAPYIESFQKTKDFWGNKKNDGSSKVKHIMNVFGVSHNHRFIEHGKCNVSVVEIMKGLHEFPINHVRNIANNYLEQYNLMMNDMLKHLEIS